MFWRNIYTPSRIDTLLDNENITLQELMEEDDIVQECKSSNKKLIDFLARSEIVDSLLKMVLEEPANESNEKLHFKYSNIACELIASDVNEITDILAMADASISSLLSFLERPEPLNPLQASFFSKIMGLLISRKSDTMLESVKSRDGFIGHLLRHLGTSAVMDLLLRLMTCVDAVECRVKYITWLNDEKLVQHLVNLISLSETSETNTNAAQTLCDIIRLGRDSSSSLPDEPSLDILLKELEKSELLSVLLDRMFNGDNCESVIVNGLYVLQALLEPKRTNELLSEEKSEMCDIESVDVNQGDLYKTLSQYLKHFHNLLLHPPKQHYTPMPLSVGTIAQPLGITRLQVASVITLLVAANNTAIDSELASLCTVGCLLNLFFQFPWNNFLHTQVELCISAIVGQKSAENPLLPQVVKDFDLLRKIVEAFDESQDQQEQQGKQRLGYLGHLTRIANLISSKVTMDAESHLLAKLFKELPEDGQQQWNSFVGGKLSTINCTNAIELGGASSGRGRLASSSEDDDDVCHLNFQMDDNLQKAFADYQTQHMTNNFVDQFGFGEEEIFEQEESISSQFISKISSIDLELDMVEDSPTAVAMFEQACNDQIRQFDSNDSDGDSDMKEMFGFSGVSNRRSSANPDGDNRQSFNNDDDDEDNFGVEEMEDNNESTDSNEDLSPRLMQKANEGSSVDRDIKVPSELINNNVPHPVAAAAAAAADTPLTAVKAVNGEATVPSSDDGALLSNDVELSCCVTNSTSEVANGVGLEAIDIHISNELSQCSLEGLTDHRQLVAGASDVDSNST